MRLTSITLRGTMQGPLWWPVGEFCETEFCKDFAAPHAPHSPWQVNWTNLASALQTALKCGDFRGGMGGLVCGQIIYRLAGEGRLISVAKPLRDMSAAKDFLLVQENAAREGHTK